MALKYVICNTCGKEFEKEQHRINRTTSGKHYCSKECYRANPIATQEKTGREIACDYCGSIVYRSGSQLKRSKSGNHFCSKQCSQKYLSNMIMSNHNTVCDNCDKTFRKSPSCISSTNFCCRECWKEYIKSTGPAYYRKIKKKVCDTCGFIPYNKCQLDIHHVDGDKTNNIADNLQTVCANCHRLIHYLIRENIECNDIMFFNTNTQNISAGGAGEL